MLYILIKIFTFGPKVFIKLFKIRSTMMTIIKIIIITLFLNIIAYIQRIIGNSKDFKDAVVSNNPTNVKESTNLNSKIKFNNK